MKACHKGLSFSFWVLDQTKPLNGQPMHCFARGKEKIGSQNSPLIAPFYVPSDSLAKLARSLHPSTTSQLPCHNKMALVRPRLWPKRPTPTRVIHPVQLNNPLPNYEGPKLHPFHHRSAPIYFVDLLNAETPGEDGWVFEVVIELKRYALKVVSRVQPLHSKKFSFFKLVNMFLTYINFRSLNSMTTVAI